MARTKNEAGRDEVRTRLLAEARAIALEHGHEALSLREVARRAGYAVASLYEYFDGRDEVLRALAAQANEALRGALAEAPGRARGRERLVRLGLAYVAFARAHKEDFLLLFARLPSVRRAQSEPVAESSAFRVVVEEVARAAGAEELHAPRSADVERIAYALWATVHGMAMLQLTHLEGFDADFAAADRAALEALTLGFAS